MRVHLVVFLDGREVGTYGCFINADEASRSELLIHHVAAQFGLLVSIKHKTSHSQDYRPDVAVDVCQIVEELRQCERNRKRATERFAARA